MTIPLRHRLLLIAAAGIVPMAFASALALYGFFHEQRQQAERTALEVTRALSTAVDAELRHTVAALQTLVASLEDAQAPEDFRAAMAASLATRRNWNGLLLSAPSGEHLINTRIPAGQPIPPSPQRNTVVQVARTREPVVGNLAKGPTLGWVIPVRVPVIRDGAVKYIMSAAVTPESILEVIRRQRLAEGWVVTAVDDKGLRVLRWPRQAEYIGTPVSGTLRKMMDTGALEATGVTTTSEGRQVYSAFSRSGVTGWTVALGIPRGEVEAPAWRSLKTFGGGFAISLVLGVLGALIVTRSTMAALARERDARAFAEGESRAKDEFLAMLGHELRNPLGAASNAAYLLQAPNVPEPARKRATDIILRQINHLAHLTDDLLDVGRALTGKIALRRQPVDLATGARHAIASLREAGRLARHHVEESLRPAWADMDPVRLEQMITNLLVNAVKYTPEGGHIRIVTAREDGESVVRLVDDGIGLAPDLAARVFDLFVQGDRELDRAQGGLGIGLTLVRRLAELHGGNATVASAGPGKGSEFMLRFPAIEAGTVAIDRGSSDAAGPREVLLVEDNEDARETLRLLLEARGHRVSVAADGPQGLEMARAGQYDAALVDIGLPGLDGYQVARRIREARAGGMPYLVALTGYGQDEDRRRALEAGFDAHLVKPVDPERLDAVLATAREGRAA